MLWRFFRLSLAIQLVCCSGIDDYLGDSGYGKEYAKPNGKDIHDFNEYVLLPRTTASQEYSSVLKQPGNYENWCPDCAEKKKRRENSYNHPQAYFTGRSEFNMPEKENVYMLTNYEKDIRSGPRYARLLPVEYYEPHAEISDDNLNYENNEHSHMRRSMIRQPLLSNRYRQYHHPSFGSSKISTGRNYLPINQKSYIYSPVSSGRIQGYHITKPNPIIDSDTHPHTNIGINSVEILNHFNSIYSSGELVSSHEVVHNVNEQSHQASEKYLKSTHETKVHKQIQTNSETYTDVSSEASIFEIHHSEEHHFHEESNEEDLQSTQLLASNTETGIEEETKDCDKINNDELSKQSSERQLPDNEDILEAQELSYSLEKKHFASAEKTKSLETYHFKSKETDFASQKNEDDIYSVETQSSGTKLEYHVSEEQSLETHQSSSKEIVYSSENHNYVSGETGTGSETNSNEKIVNSYSAEYLSKDEKASQSVEKSYMASAEIDAASREDISGSEEMDYISETHTLHSKEESHSYVSKSSESREVTYNEEDNISQIKEEVHYNVETHSSESKESYMNSEKHMNENLYHSSENISPENVAVSLVSEEQSSEIKEIVYSAEHTSKNEDILSSIAVKSSEDRIGEHLSHSKEEEYLSSEKTKIESKEITLSSETQSSEHKEIFHSAEKHSLESKTKEDRHSIIKHVSSSKEIDLQIKKHHSKSFELSSCEQPPYHSQENTELSNIDSVLKHSSEDSGTKCSDKNTDISGLNPCHEGFHVIETKDFRHHLYSQIPNNDAIFNLDLTSHEETDIDSVNNRITGNDHQNQIIHCNSGVCPTAMMYDISSLQDPSRSPNLKNEYYETYPEVSKYTNNQNQLNVNDRYNIQQYYNSKLPIKFMKKLKNRTKNLQLVNDSHCGECMKKFQRVDFAWQKPSFQNNFKSKRKKKCPRGANEYAHKNFVQTNHLSNSEEIDVRLNNIGFIYSSYQ